MAKLKEKPEPVTQGDLRAHNSRGMLLSFVERYERMTEEIDALSDDRKEILAEAKGSGYDTAILREVIRRRAKGTATIQEHDAILEMYEKAVADAEKDQLKESERLAGDPPPPAPAPKPFELANKPPAEAAKPTLKWGRKPAPASVEAPTDEEVAAKAAAEIGHAADHPADGQDENNATDVGNIPSFLRR